MQILVPLWELRPYDEASPHWSPLYHLESVTGSALAIVSGTTITPPVEKAWVVKGSYLSNSPTGGVAALNNEIRVNTAPPGAANLAVIHAGKWPTNDLAAGETVTFSQQHDGVVLIGGVHYINAIWQVSGGNVANVFGWGFHGYEIPRANVVLR